MKTKIKRTIAILLLVCFMLSITVADVSASNDKGENIKVKFTDKSTGSPTFLKWSFGDGKHSTANNPTHTFRNGVEFDSKKTVGKITTIVE